MFYVIDDDPAGDGYGERRRREWLAGTDERTGLQIDAEGYVPRWATTEQAQGTETVQAHLMDGEAHGLTAVDIAGMSVSDCHRLHDQLHKDAGHNEMAMFHAMLMDFLNDEDADDGVFIVGTPRGLMA